MLTIDGIVAGYGLGDILKGVDLRLERGTITCIIGPNGAGKSTVLKAISGLLKPSAGSISFDDAPIGACRRVRCSIAASSTCRRSAACSRS